MRVAAPERALAPPAPAHDDLRTFVTIARTDAKDIGQRQIFVRLDAGPWEPFVFGETRTLEVLPGAHRMRVHNTLFWRTIDFAVESGEHLEFSLINWASWFTMTTSMWLGTGLIYLKVERRTLR
jgi:hypothetical protein